MPRNSLDELLELQLECLHGLFDIKDEPSILHFLRSHRDVFALLRAGCHALHAAFDDVDHEGSYGMNVSLVRDGDVLRATLIVFDWWLDRYDVTGVTADSLFLAFERDWWLQNCQRPGGSSIVFDWRPSK